MKKLDKAIGKVNISLGELLYYLFWGVMLFAKGVGWYDGMFVYKICLLIAIFCIGMKLCLTEHTVAEWIFIIGLSMLGMIAYFNSHEKGILQGILALIGLKGIPLRRLFKIGLVLWGGCFLVMNIQGMFDIFPGAVFVHEKNIIGVVLRKSLGYSHPNVLHISYGVLVAFILYLWTKKGLGKYFFLMLGNIYIFLYSLSYTGFLFVILLLLSDIYFTYRKKISGPEKILVQAVLPLSMIFAIVAPRVLDPDSALYRLINKVMNVRFYASRVIMEWTPISLFGTEVQLNGWALDSSYVNLFLSYGIIFFILFFILFFAVVRAALAKDDRKGLSLIIPFLITGVMEPFLANTAFKNLTLFLAGVWLFQIFFHYPLFTSHIILGKKVEFLRNWDKYLYIPANYSETFVIAAQRIKSKWKKIGLVLSIIMGIGTSIFSYGYIDTPEEIYIGQQNTDLDFSTQEYYLDIANLPMDFHGVIYAYQDLQSPLHRLEAEQLQYEYFRKSISFGVGVFGISYLLFMVGLLSLKLDTPIQRAYVNYKWRRQSRQYGHENPDKTFYVVRRAPGKLGLFSYVMTNVGHIKYALSQGFIPVVDMKNSPNTYLRGGEVRIINAWELFFEQPCGYTLEDIADSQNIVLSNGLIDDEIPYPEMEITRNEENLEEWRSVFQKYIILKTEIKKETEKLYVDLFAGRKVLGVLCRGTDYVNARPSGHPVQPDLPDIINKVKEICEKRHCECIYLATEDENVYQAFLKQFRERLAVTSARRYQDTSNKNINEIIEQETDDKYLQGKDYLINIVLLSRCDCLVAGCTGGTYGALLMSKGYEEQYLFDLGLY